MAKSRVNNKTNNKKINLKWWYVLPVLFFVALAGYLIVRFSNASTNGKADFTVNPTGDFSVAILKAKNGASVEVNSCLYLNDAYGGVEQVRVWYRRLSKDPQDSKVKTSLYDGYYAVSSNQVPSQLQYGGTWLDNNQSANSYLPEKTFNVNFPDLYFNKYKTGENRNQKIYVGLFYGTNPFNKDIKNPSQKDTDFTNDAILARGGQAISVNQLKLCLNSPNQKLANKQAVPKKINGTKSDETRLNRDGDAPYSKSLENVKNSKNYIGTITSKYAGNFYVTACARSEGGSIFTIDSAAWFADPRYVAWGKFGTNSDFWIKNNGTEVAGPTSGKWAYGAVASLKTRAIDYSNSAGLEFGITDYNTFANPPLLDVASLQFDMTKLKMCDSGKTIPPKSNYIVPSITGNSQQTIDQANSGTSGNSIPFGLNSQGDNVAYIQRALGITADGIFGQETLQRVTDFQSKNGLPETGIVDYLTYNLLDISYTKRTASAAESLDSCRVWYKQQQTVDIYWWQYRGDIPATYSRCRELYNNMDPSVIFPSINNQYWTKDHFQWAGNNYK